MSYTFSIIIPTFNRKKYLLETLDFIKEQTIQPVEVIVVDVSELQFQLNDIEIKKYQPLLNYIPWSEYGNISKQRNHGIQLAKGDVILFLDDDVTFEKDLIENYITAFNETKADGISGLVETEKYRKGHKPLFFKGILNDIKEPNFQPCDFIAPTKVICTASFAVKTKALKAIKGFDELQRGSYDDLEVGFRLIENGYVILHHPLPVVFHIQAMASGARDLKHGNLWSIENQVYFMLKHKYNTKRNIFLWKLYWEGLRPSRAWLKPYSLFERLKLKIKAYKRAVQLLKK